MTVQQEVPDGPAPYCSRGRKYYDSEKVELASTRRQSSTYGKDHDAHEVQRVKGHAGKIFQLGPMSYRLLASARKTEYYCRCMTPPVRLSSTSDPAPVIARATVSAAARLGLKNRQLAGIIGTSEASISRLRAGRGLDPDRKDGELALLFLRLYRSLDALVGGDDTRARAWLHAQNDHIGGIPADRIQTVEGLIDVVQYLDAMRGRL